jgi:hypothetical protein
MNNSRNYSNAKILILIPIFVFAITVICMGLATILEAPTNRGTIYTIFAFIGLMSMLLAPLPCLIMSVIGIIFAIKAKKEGIAQSGKYIVIGIIEILPHGAGLLLAIAMFIAGQGV